MGGPDLVGHPVELGEVLLAEAHLLLPAGLVDRQDPVEVLGRDVDALEVELLLGRDDADRRTPSLDLAEGVYDGLTLGAEATSAAEGKEGILRYDPMSNRPFMAYGEGDYARHYLDIVGAATDQPIFAHVNWFQRDAEDGHFLWPGYRDNLRPLLWLLQLRNGEVEGRRTAVGILPTEEELDLDGMDVPAADLERILTIDKERWQQEMGFREEHLSQFDRMPEEIWEAHRRVAGDLGSTD